MKCIIRLSATLVPAIENLLSQWEQDHAGYYGRPHGSQYVPLPVGLAEIQFREGVDEDRVPRKGYLGYTRLPNQGFRWLRSSGNWAAVLHDGEGWILVIESRRHGIPDGVLGLLDRFTWDPDSRVWRDPGSGIMAELVSLESQAPAGSNPLLPVPHRE